MNAKAEKYQNKKKKGSKKKKIDNFRQKEGNIAKTIQRKKRKRVREKIPGGNSQGPFSKQRRENENAQGRKNKNEKTMKIFNGDKKGMIIFNPKNDDQNEKNPVPNWLAAMNINLSFIFAFGC